MTMYVWLALAAVVGLGAAAAAAAPADFYVAPNGRDTWSGKLSAPNRARTDGPFASVHAAQDAVRRIRSSRPGTRRIVVLIRKGDYELDAPITIGPDESGTPEGPTVYAAYLGEKPVLSGGRRLSGWRAVGNRWVLDLPEVRDGRWRFSQLFVNGQRRYRPRLPKNGFYHIESEATPSSAAAGRGYDRFVYRAGDIKAEWKNRADVDVLCFQSWTMARMRIGDLDAATRTIRTAAPTIAAVGFFSLAQGNRYIVENVREALTEPGEWYLDATTGVLEYLPMPGESLATADIRAPFLEAVVQMQGDVAARRWVENVELRGLTFAHTNWVCPPDGYQAPQAEVVLPGAIRATGARRCRLDGCTITHTGAYAVEFGAACQGMTIENCRITDMGAGGVKLGETSGAADPDLLSGGHTVRNCLIAHGGRLHPAGIGVWIGASPNNTVSHNEICDLYYSAISVGWSWGYAPTASHRNTLEYNYAHHIGQGVLSDMGATYTLGTGAGSVQRFNHFHDIESFGYGGWGIYFDEGTTGMLAENNLVYRCKSAGFHQHYGRDNIVRNNIFAMNRESQLMRTRAEEHLSFTFERNIVYWDTGALLASNWSGDKFRLDSNLYWRKGGKPFDLAGKTLAEWQASGQDGRSMVADPMFVDPEKLDFRLRPGSPAARIGFVPFDIRPAGRIGIGSRKPEPLAPRAYPPPPPPPPPGPIKTGFEEQNVGERAVNATTVEENGEATIRVTDTTAASGKHSLKFEDRAGQKAQYNPHLWYSPRFADGVVVASFALRIEAGTPMYHEWRDAAATYHVGPSFAVAPDGALTAAGRKLADLPAGQWVRFEIRCPIGDRAAAKYELVIRLPGRTAPLTFSGLGCSSEFRSLDWFGFVANADGPGCFYLDDVDVRQTQR
jgi:hypothetical protein